MVNKQNKKAKRNYTLRFYKKDKLVERYQTKSIRKFLHRVRSIKWTEDDIKVYLRVYYGKGYSVNNKLVGFHNDGIYKNKEDFDLALEAFLED